MMKAPKTILVVDDEEDILELVRLHLEKEKYSVLTATTGEDALEIAREQKPSLIVLDLMLPGISGLDVCKILKRDTETRDIHIIMLSAKSEDSDIVSGLELGADDYITKPFSPKVLMARIRKVLLKKQQDSHDQTSIRIRDMVINPSRYEVVVNDETIKLTFTEFKILHALARRPGVVFTRYQIVDSLHGSDYVVTDRAVDVQIAYLRRKLGKHRGYIETVRGVGYRLCDQDL